MTHYAATVTSPGLPEEVFEYLADFSSTAEWDPGVSEAWRLTGEPLRVGARFHVVADFLGRRVALEYRTVEIDPPRRVVLRAETATVVSEDTITVRGLPGSGSEVTYDASLAPPGSPAIRRPVPRACSSSGSAIGRKRARPRPWHIASAARRARTGAPR